MIDQITVKKAESVFGEWKEKREPIVFDTVIERAPHSLFGPGKGLIWSAKPITIEVQG